MTLYDLVASPLGTLLLTSDGDALTGVYFEGHRRGPTVGPAWRREPAVLAAAADQLAAHLEGDLAVVDVPLAPVGTRWQHAVWARLRDVPRGETTTYGTLAAELGAPTAARAVASAVARNPISIIVPCHRVVGANGALTGYAGGVERKRWLLEREGWAPVALALA